MTSTVNIISSLDGSNIKDDVIKKLNDGSDGMINVKRYRIGEILEIREQNPVRRSDVNVLIVTPSICSEVEKYADRDFAILFPNIDKSLLLVCDTESEIKISSIISKTADYANICRFDRENASEWKYLMVPTILKMAAMEQEKPRIPDINRYIIRPKRIDSFVDQVCVIFLDDIETTDSVTISAGGKTMNTSKLSSGVYVFSPQALSPGVYEIKVNVGGADYGCTTLEVQSDIDKLKDVFHRAAQKDPLLLLSMLLRSDTTNREDIERDIIDILQEKPFNPAFLNLLEGLLRLEPADGSQEKDHEGYFYPTLLHFCAANGMSILCEWLLYNTSDDKKCWKNSEGLIPQQMAERENHTDLQKLLDPENPLAGPPVGSRGKFSADSDDEEPVILPSPLSPGYRRTSVPSSFYFPSPPGIDSGRSSFSSGTGHSAENIPVSSVQKKEHPYDSIEDDKSAKKLFAFRKKSHTYSEIEDLDTSVQWRPIKDPPYEDAWERNPIPDKLPIKPVPGERKTTAEGAPRSSTIPNGNRAKSSSLPRGRTLDGMSGNTRL